MTLSATKAAITKRAVPRKSRLIVLSLRLQSSVVHGIGLT